MGYFAVKGGVDAIANAAELVEYYRLRERTTPVEIAQIRAQFGLALDKIMGEGSLYAPEHAAIAFKQVEGDVLEAAFIMRAYRATLERRYYSTAIDVRNMFVLRRISSTFKDIPGGQVLGSTRDYTQRLLDPEIIDETSERIEDYLRDFDRKVDPQKLRRVVRFGRVSDLLKEEGLLVGRDDEDRRLVDVTREAVKFPAPRSAALQMLARAETGGLMALGYAGMRGHGASHGTIGELRVGRVDVRISDPRGRTRYIGRLRVTECEMVDKISGSRKKGSAPRMSIGYGLCFGHNETKAIAMGLLDTAMRNDSEQTLTQEFVLYHTEGVESMGFINHLKLPHYVTFQASLNNLRGAIDRLEGTREKTGFSGLVPVRVDS
jgi:alpha-D-ribose 1-methylphosphonate 5-triphosphate synthase subunit PhnI